MCETAVRFPWAESLGVVATAGPVSRTAGRLLLWSPHMEGAGGGLEHPSTHHSRSCLGSGLNQGASGLLVGF